MTAPVLTAPVVCPHCGRLIVTGEPRIRIGGDQWVHLPCAAHAQRAEAAERAS